MGSNVGPRSAAGFLAPLDLLRLFPPPLLVAGVLLLPSVTMVGIIWSIPPVEFFEADRDEDLSLSSSSTSFPEVSSRDP